MLQLRYENKDITSSIAIASAQAVDSAGGALDSLEVVFSDTLGLWSSWSPKEGVPVSLTCGSFATGECYVDQLGQKRGLYLIRALSAPRGCKISRSRSWEQVTLLQLAADVAITYGFTVKGIDIDNQTYHRVDQCGISDLELLNEICVREGYAIKVMDKQLIIYNEVAVERATPAKTLGAGSWWGSPDYQADELFYTSCTVAYGGLTATFDTGKSGETLTVGSVPIYSVGEGHRFAKGLLRKSNRTLSVVKGSVELDTELAGGSIVQVQELGSADGKYVVDMVDHDFVNGRSSLRLRRCLEGY